MTTEIKIYVAGHGGLVGSALLRRLTRGGYHRLVTRTREELDLTEQSRVRDFFEREKPECVFLAAARVGGVHANNTYPAEFIHSNLAVQTNVIHEAWRSGVKKLLFLGSSCVYPRDCPQPIKEEYLLSSPLEKTNEPYAVAKIAGIKMCGSYNRQYGTNFMSVMPTNLYGPGDHYDLETSHVLPALLRKIHEAKTKGLSEVVLWGTGKPRREFLFVDDLADACVFLMERFDARDIGEIINIGAGKDLSILELADELARAVGYKGKFVFDASKPDGTLRKLLDVSRLTALGWTSTTDLKQGIQTTYADFLKTLAVR